MHVYTRLLPAALALLFLGAALPVAVAVFLAGSFALGLTAAKRPSTGSGKAKLDELLPEHLEGDSFTMHYRVGTEDRAPGAAPAAVPLTIKRLFRDAEFHVHAFHAYPHERTIVKTQSIIELPPL